MEALVSLRVGLSMGMRGPRELAGKVEAIFRFNGMLIRMYQRSRVVHTCYSSGPKAQPRWLTFTGDLRIWDTFLL